MPASAATAPADLDTEQVARLRAAVTRLHRRLRQEGGGGVSASQLAVLGSLNRHGPLTLGELAAAEGVQPPSMTRTARALEEAGLISRTVDAGDRRVARVELTLRARRLIQGIRHRRDAWLLASVDRLSARERGDLLRGLAALERLLEVGA